jgi:hypothetical protein
MNWKPMSDAPRGGGAEMVTDPNWLEPPLVYLLFGEGQQCVAKWDWYYAHGGIGYSGLSAWVEPCSGELAALHYNEPVAWMPLIPLAPKEPEQ